MEDVTLFSDPACKRAAHEVCPGAPEARWSVRPAFSGWSRRV